MRGNRTMRLSTAALLSAVVLLAASSGIAQESVPALPPAAVVDPIPGTVPGGVLTPIPGTAPSNYPTIPGSGNAYPELSTGVPGRQPYPSIDPNCQGIGGPTYEVWLDGLLWNLRPALGQQLALRTRDFSTAFDTGGLDMGYEPGARVHIGYLTEEGENFEVDAFGIYNWDANNSVFDTNGGMTTSTGIPLPGGLQLPGDLGNAGFTANYSTGFLGTFAAANAVSAGFAPNQSYYSSTYQMAFRDQASMNNVELNLASGDKDSNVKYLVGVRYIKFDEQSSIASTSTLYNVTNPNNPYTVATGLVSHYNIYTRNEAFGLNFGVRVRNQLWNCWELEQVGKCAVMSNSARENQFVGDFNDRIVLRDTGASSAPVAFLAEYNFSAVRHLSDTTAVRIGYNICWLDGIARATDQLDFHVGPTAGSVLQLGAGAFMQGLNVGYEMSW